MENNQSSQQQQVIDNSQQQQVVDESQQQQVVDESHYEKVVALLEEQSKKSNDIYETSQVQAATLLYILVTILSIMIGKLFMAIFKILK